MKRWSIWICAGVLILACIIGFTRTAIEPSDFTGKWYYAEDMSAYLFHNGVIISEAHHIDMDEDEIFSGAYSFARNKIYLFLAEDNRVGELLELSLNHSSIGDTLCDSKTGTVIFYRERLS